LYYHTGMKTFNKGQSEITITNKCADIIKINYIM
jgi:hypothetical protein